MVTNTPLSSLQNQIARKICGLPLGAFVSEFAIVLA